MKKPASEDNESPLRIGKDEMNLVENPIALLTDHPDPDQKVLKFVRPVEGKNGKITESTWTVTGSEQYGLPLASDEDIYLILMELTKEQGFQERTVYFSRYEIVRRLKGPRGTISGSDYERITAALNRLVGVTIYATRWYNRSTKRFHAIGFHILENVSIADEPPGRKRTSQAPLRMSYVTWDATVFKSFQDGYIKNLDLARYFSLKSAISRRLYRFLDKRFYDGKPKFEIGLRMLAHEHLGLSRNYKYESHLKAKMKRAHEELIQAGCISGVEFRQGKDGLVVIYRPAKKYASLDAEEDAALLPSETEAAMVPQIAPEVKSEVSETFQWLIEVGVTRGTAEELLLAYPEERVREKLAYLSYMKPRPRNPGGWVRRAIEQDWAAPPEYLKDQRKNEMKKISTASREEPPNENRGEALLTALSDLPAEERESFLVQATNEARKKHPKAAELFDRGKGVRAWNKLVDGELMRLVLGNDAMADRNI